MYSRGSEGKRQSNNENRMSNKVGKLIVVQYTHGCKNYLCKSNDTGKTYFCTDVNKAMTFNNQIEAEQYAFVYKAKVEKFSLLRNKNE